MASSILALIVGLVSQALNVLNPAANPPVNGQAFAVPSSAGMDISWDVTASGTALATVQVDLQGSLDATFTNPSQVDTVNVVGSFARSVTGKQWPFLRIRVVAATGGDATSQLVGRLYVKKRGADV